MQAAVRLQVCCSPAISAVYATESRWRKVFASSVGIQPGSPKRACLPAHSIATWNCISSRAASCIRRMCTIGVVEGIVSIDEYDVEIRGFANHAGTTPMKERHNALLAAAKLIEAVQEVVTREPGRQVGTVGRLQVFPNAPNVVLGLVKHSIELRDLSAETVARLGNEIQKRAQEIARDTGTEIIMERVEHAAPAVADLEMQAKIEVAATELGLKTMRLPSGAGHDAQMMAKIGPIGMIFVPSVDGISHSPKEFTRWQDCANGANVLLRTILLIDRATP